MTTFPHDPKLLILDCDGVLVRSERANLAYYNHLFMTFGRPSVDEGEREKVLRLHTLSTPQVIDVFFPEELRGEVARYAASLEYETFGDLLEPEPGWDAVLPELSGRMSVCVATNRGRSAPAVVGAVGLAEWVEKIFTLHDVKNPKPAPDLLHLALDCFGRSPREAVYVGDSELDRRAAEAAGVPFIGYRLDATVSVSDPWELKARLSAGRRAAFDAVRA
jgi:phosphoglycolate phosphatase